MSKESEEFKNIVEAAKKITLTKEEKNSARKLLKTYIEENPRITFFQKIWNSINVKKLILKPAYIAVLIIILGGAGTAYGAEISLPGDLLYSVKIYVNEEVREKLTFSEEGKAKWEIKRMERRLEEVEKLIEKQKFNEEIREKIESNFARHAEKMNKVIEKLQIKNPDLADQIKERLGNSIEVHEKVLEKMMDKKEKQDAKIESIMLKMKEIKSNMPHKEGKIQKNQKQGKINKNGK